MQIKKWAAAALTASALGIAAPAQSAILADILWVVDISGSMGDDISQVKTRISQFDAVMTANGVDARYGLVRFGGAASFQQNLTTYTDFIRTGGPFDSTGANGGGTEDGSDALNLGITAASWRANSVRNLILITDEDDDNAGNRSALQTTLNGTTERELINIIGNPNDDAGNYYRTLAPANGGQFFNILDFRNNPAPFFTNFVNTKLNEIVVDFCTRNPTDPQCVNRVSEPGSLVLAFAGLLGLLGFAAKRRRRA